MLFNSISYLLFLTVVVGLYWLSPDRYRIWILLLASIAFYAFWRWEFVFLIAFSAWIDYFFSLRIYGASSPFRRKLFLLCSLSTNLGLLLYFKYTYFILENISFIGEHIGRDWRIDPGTIILPLGISFYTFLSISYTLDVYRKLFEPVRSFQLYLTYVVFWPHMIAGPILRAHELITQLVRRHPFSVEQASEGIRYILFGLFLKVVLADNLAPLVDAAFASSPSALGGVDVWTMAFAFGFQIYFDFAGYSMVAIGSARLLGVRFPENFNWPYLATSPREFWKRWHITLSSWIRDYLYLPLCGMRFRDVSEGGLEIREAHQGNAIRAGAALFVTWFIMGLWHGASWRFAFWGLWHAAFIVAYRAYVRARLPIPARIASLVGWGLTLAVTMLGWIPFRAKDLSTAVAYLGRVLDLRSYHQLAFRENFYLVTFLALLSMILLRGAYGLRTRFPESTTAYKFSETATISVVMFLVFIFLRPISQFIYFQF